MHITMEQVDHAYYVMVKPDRALFFPSVETIRTKLISANTAKSKDVEANNSQNNQELPIIFDFSYVCEMDFTAAKGIRALSKILKKNEKQFVKPVTNHCGL